MPELPEVETITRRLDHELAGQTVKDILVFKTGREFPAGASFAKKLINKKLVKVYRRAKLIIWEFQSGFDRTRRTWDVGRRTNLVTHLKMTGKLVLIDKRYFPTKHDRMIFDFGNKRLLWSDMRTFGFMRIVSNRELVKILDSYGPEPLDLKSEEISKRISEFKRSKIKSALMDQKIIAGIGNIYADEALFDANINPSRPTWTLTKPELLRLARSIQKILRQSIKVQGTSFRDYVNAEGKKGGFENKLKVYGKKGLPCPVCATAIQKTTVSQRGTHFCPKCQP
ncbi:MAG: bifunctional DNA-formamidopyrimidine glycosylase/DNA-(apurinic or apyrimidinic site) lyase [Patescibacteria group bacterium]